jgi:hypothetical protein
MERRRFLHKPTLIKELRKLLKILTPEMIDELDLSYLKNNDLSRLIKETMKVIHKINEDLEAIK